MVEIKRLFLVGLGGSAGAIFRYLVARIFAALEISSAFPYHTLLVNIVGCFVIGLLNTLYPSVENNQMTRLFLITGVVGGFTTFSAFGIESIELFKAGLTLSAICYISSSVMVGLVSVMLGSSLADSLK